MLNLRTLFDNTYYLETNPDVALAVAQGLVSSGLDHFNRFGKQEGRDPNALFDTSYYLEVNPDVAIAVAEGSITAIDHFIEFGQIENRDPNRFFDTEFYIANNTDVNAAIRRGEVSAFEHYLRSGQFENRLPSLLFDPDYYLERYPLIQLSITNGVVKSAIDHFLRFGLEEGLRSTPPDANDDLITAQSLGVLNGTTLITDFVGNQEPVDIYSFIINSPSNFSATLNSLNADADLELIRDVGRNGIINVEDIVNYAANFGTAADELISAQPLEPGQYFVRVTQFQGDTTYNLTLSV